MGDLKIYHVDRNMVSYKNTRLEFIYGEIHGSQGKNNNYIGMYLDLSSKVESKVSMEDYLNKVNY